MHVCSNCIYVCLLLIFKIIKSWNLCALSRSVCFVDFLVGIHTIGQQTQYSEWQEEFRALKKLIVEKTVDESRALSYAEYYDEKMREGRIETWRPTLKNATECTQLPVYLMQAPSGSEKDTVKPFWKDVLSRHQLLPAWKNGYEIAHLVRVVEKNGGLFPIEQSVKGYLF